MLVALAAASPLAHARQVCAPSQPDPECIQTVLNRALDAAVASEPTPEARSTRRVMLKAALAHSNTCYAGNLTDEQMLAILQRTGALNPSADPRALRFVVDVNAWLGEAQIGPSGTSRRASLTYSFPDDGASWGSACGGVNIIQPNNLNARLITRFTTLDRGREMIRSSIAAFRRYAGVTYSEVPDDNQPMSMSTARVPTRGDIRIGAIPLGSPTTSPLAYNAFPQGGTGGSVSQCSGGDMVLNSDAFVASFFNSAAADSLYFRNTVAHEHGHGLGLIHTVPCNRQKLMEPFIYNTRAGPGNDDIRGVQRNYGDRYAGNHTPDTARDLGDLTSPAPRSVIERDLSINGPQLFVNGSPQQTNDYFRFTLSTPQQITFTVTPTGASCPPGTVCNGVSTDPPCCTGQQSINCSGTLGLVNALAAGNLNIDIRDASGWTTLFSAGTAPAGSPETLTQTLQPGTYFIRVFDLGGTLPQNQTLQTYDLLVRVGSALAPPTAIAGLNKLATAGQLTQFIGNHNSYTNEPGATLTNASYAWDLDADGTFEVTTNPQPTFTYLSNGTVNVTLRVTDSNGLSATDTIAVTVRGATTSLDASSPSALPQGTTVPVTITGTNLRGVTTASQITVSGTGVSVTGTPVVNTLGTQITGLSLVVSAAAATGPRSLSVTNADGLNTPASNATAPDLITITQRAANDECSSPTPLGSTLGPVPASTIGATTSPAQNCPSPLPTDVWFTWTAPASGTLAVAGDGTIGSSLAAYAGTACPPAPPLDCAIDAVLSVPVLAGQTYLLRLGSDQSQTVGSQTLTLALSPADGACCATDGACTLTAPGACTGTFNGAATCSPNPCPQPTVACCAPDGSCSTITPSACTTSGGVAQPAGSACSPNPCPQPAGACCRGSTCSVLTQALCLPPGPGIGASFVPASTACNAPGATASPCCLADFDKAGGRSIDDIFIYLNAWFASSEFANFAEPGQPNIDDIFVFLNAWFAGCD